MADLYHLLDDLQEREVQQEEDEEQERLATNDDDDDDDVDQDGGVYVYDDQDQIRGGGGGATKRKSTKNDDNRRLTVETAVTADMSYYDDDEEGGEDNDHEDGRPRRPDVPEALRQYHTVGDDDSSNVRGIDDGRGGGIEDLLEEEGFDMVDGNRKRNHLGKSRTDTSDSNMATMEDEDMADVGKLYGYVHRRWMEEQHSPELVPYDEDFVEKIKLILQKKQDQIDDDSAEVPAGCDTHVHLLMTDIQQQDIDRVKFVLADWIDLRLAKIEAYPLHHQRLVVGTDTTTTTATATNKNNLMSQHEVGYLNRYWELERRVLESTTTDYLPDEFRSLTDEKMIDEPDTDGYHFWVVQDDEPLVLGDEVHDEHSCLIAKYSKMKRHMKGGKVRLLM